jgi:hypothetical protein
MEDNGMTKFKLPALPSSSSKKTSVSVLNKTSDLFAKYNLSKIGNPVILKPYVEQFIENVDIQKVIGNKEQSQLIYLISSFLDKIELKKENKEKIEHIIKIFENQQPIQFKKIQKKVKTKKLNDFIKNKNVRLPNINHDDNESVEDVIKNKQTSDDEMIKILIEDFAKSIDLSLTKNNNNNNKGVDPSLTSNNNNNNTKSNNSTAHNSPNASAVASPKTTTTSIPRLSLAPVDKKPRTLWKPKFLDKIESIVLGGMSYVQTFVNGLSVRLGDSNTKACYNVDAKLVDKDVSSVAEFIQKNSHLGKKFLTQVVPLLLREEEQEEEEEQDNGISLIGVNNAMFPVENIPRSIADEEYILKMINGNFARMASLTQGIDHDYTYNILDEACISVLISPSIVGALDVSRAQINRIPGCETFTLKELIMSDGVKDIFQLRVMYNFLLGNGGYAYADSTFGKVNGSRYNISAGIKQRALLASQFECSTFWFQDVVRQKNPRIVEIENYVNELQNQINTIESRYRLLFAGVAEANLGIWKQNLLGWEKAINNGLFEDIASVLNVKKDFVNEITDARNIDLVKLKARDNSNVYRTTKELIILKRVYCILYFGKMLRNSQLSRWIETGKLKLNFKPKNSPTDLSYVTDEIVLQSYYPVNAVNNNPWVLFDEKEYLNRLLRLNIAKTQLENMPKNVLVHYE